jgi:hypothetical protein
LSGGCSSNFSQLGFLFVSVLEITLFNFFTEQVLFSSLFSLVKCSSVLIHPFNHRQRAFWDDALLDLNPLEVFDLLLFFKALEVLGALFLLVFHPAFS